MKARQLLVGVPDPQAGCLIVGSRGDLHANRQTKLIETHGNGQRRDSILVQQRRDQYAAETFLRRVIAPTGSEPRVVITDKLSSYPPAMRRVLPNVDHRRHQGLNNRAENSHQRTRQRERLMRRFESPEHAQRFLGPFGMVGDHFRVGRYSTAAATRRQLLVERRSTWREVVGLRVTA